MPSEGEVVDVEKGSWFSRGLNKLSAAASTVKSKTASLLDFHSGAADIICVKHKDGTVQCTGFNVHIARDAKSSLRNETIEVFVNDHLSTLRMSLDDKHNGHFLDGGIVPSEDQLKNLPLRDGKNAIAFQLSSAPNSRCEAHLFLWTPEEALVVCDIDGPILRSDLLGYGAGKLGVGDSAHKGVCEVFNFVAATGYRVVYVSSRPITKAGKTRDLLQRIGEESERMPHGPLITTAERTISSLVRNLRTQSGADEFKVAALQELTEVVRGQGGGERRVLYGAFGSSSRPAEVQAYLAAGVASNRIFIVDEQSRLFVRETREVFTSYADLLESLPRFFPAAKMAMEHEAQLLQASRADDGEEEEEEGQDSPASKVTQPPAPPPPPSDAAPLEEAEQKEAMAAAAERRVAEAAMRGRGGAGKPAVLYTATGDKESEERSAAAPEPEEGKAHPAEASTPANQTEDADDDDDDGFDPDEWRRREKRRLKALRVAQANASWGFAADGITPAQPDTAQTRVQVAEERAVGEGGGGAVECESREEGGKARGGDEKGGEGKKSLLAQLAGEGGGATGGKTESVAEGKEEEGEAEDARKEGGETEDAGKEEASGKNPTKEAGETDAGAKGAGAEKEASDDGRDSESGRPHKGGLVGLGLTFNKWDGQEGLVIRRMKDASPAAASHLQVGERVLSIDGVSLSTLRSAPDPRRALAKLTQGEGGTKSVLVVEQADGITCEVTLERPLQPRAEQENRGGNAQ